MKKTALSITWKTDGFTLLTVEDIMAIHKQTIRLSESDIFQHFRQPFKTSQIVSPIYPRMISAAFSAKRRSLI